MRFLMLLMALWACTANAQIPRTKSGLFEYSGEVSGGNTLTMKKKARSFFNQPFLVHWDSIARADQGGNIRVMGSGYITVRAKQHSVGLPGEINVFLQMEIAVTADGFQYKVNHFLVEQPDATRFPLENKPDLVKRMAYDQLKHKTHERMTYIIGYLKKYMTGEDGQ
jgi:hypothetical protein